MAFLIRGGTDVTNREANVLFDTAETYLQHSNRAADVISYLAADARLVQILVARGDTIDEYRHPNHAEALDPARFTGGTIIWNPEVQLHVTDFTASAATEGTNTRPQVPWTREQTRLGRISECILGPRDRPGIVSAALLLLHEMGHATQYFQNPEGFMELARDDLMTLENINLATTESVAALELASKGFQEGIRWDYLHQNQEPIRNWT